MEEQSYKKRKTDSDDDIWFSDVDEEHFRPSTVNDEIFGADLNGPSGVESLALRREHAKQGFIQGILEARLTATQNGFDDGYLRGCDIGLKVGEIIGLLNCLKSSEDKGILLRATQSLELLRKELFISNILHSRYFDDQRNLNGDHEILTKWDLIVKDLTDTTNDL